MEKAEKMVVWNCESATEEVKGKVYRNAAFVNKSTQT